VANAIDDDVTAIATWGRKQTSSSPHAKEQPSSPKSRDAVLTEPKLLVGGNPQIPKGEGNGPVQAYIAAMPCWKQRVGRAIDDVIERTIPGARKAVKWNTPLYGVEGQGWFLGFNCYERYVKVTFFRGASLDPVPQGQSKQKDVRYLDIHEDDLIDDTSLSDWIRQASALPGERL
jgi:hypothetical protein